MLGRLLKSRSAKRGGEHLYAAAVAQARDPVFYDRLAVPDQIDARFELYTLHVLVLVLRLRDEGEAGLDAAQSLFDAYVSALDNALRELGVGDLSMSRKMRNLGEALYGRMTSYEPPLRAGDVAALGEALARNVYAEEGSTHAAGLAAYALAARAGLVDQPFAAVLAAPVWPEIAP